MTTKKTDKMTPEAAIKIMTDLGTTHGKGTLARQNLYVSFAEVVRDGGVDMTTVERAKVGQKPKANDLDKLWDTFQASALKANPNLDVESSRQVRTAYTTIAHASNADGLDFAKVLTTLVVPIWSKLATDQRKRLHVCYAAVAVKQHKANKEAKAGKWQATPVSNEVIEACCKIKPKATPQLFKFMDSHVKALTKLIAGEVTGITVDDDDKATIKEALDLLAPFAKVPEMNANDAAELAAFRKAAEKAKAGNAKAAERAKSVQARKDAAANKDARDAANAARVMAKAGNGKGKKNGATA